MNNHTFNDLRLTADTEEQRQSLCCSNEENTCSDDHHYFFLENLLLNCKALIINTSRKRKYPKETNWKQKFQKPQNENICLTNLNVQTNGNIPILAFGACNQCYKKVR